MSINRQNQPAHRKLRDAADVYIATMMVYSQSLMDELGGILLVVGHF